jgi:glycosyltransferase involved in cell wall biosynthesis
LHALPTVKSKKELSILLPAYNEAAQIEKCVKEVEQAASSFSDSYEIIVSEDGSTDETSPIMLNLTKNNPNLIFLHLPVRIGKGKAIKRAISSAKGDIIVFMDVDLATSLDCLPNFLDLVKKHGGLAIGSRYAKGAFLKRRVSRTIFSLAYNMFVRILFLDGVRDHQCGFKAMSSEVAKALEDIKSDGFFFDTEMIVKCKKLGFPVTEVGVEWVENRRQSESKIRILYDARKIGMDMLMFRLNGYNSLKRESRFRNQKNIS